MFATLLSIVLLAQAPAVADSPLDTGPCLDSPRPVPRVLMAPITRSMQVLRIDKVVSTSSMMPGEVIGFLYTLGDGSTWLGQRTFTYMSPAAAAASNNVLSVTHMPGQNISAFPPQMRYGVATHNTQFFRVQIAPTAMDALHIQILPCVAWPVGRTPPDPTM